MTGLGLRGKLFLTSLAVITVVGMAFGAYLEGELRELIAADVEADLVHTALMAREALAAVGPDTAAQEIDSQVDRLGAASGARVTVIAGDGRVLGDSSVTLQALANVESHRDRPEVTQALSAGRGVARRHSDTVKADMVYVAVGLPRLHGVVRAATPLHLVEDAVGRLRGLLAFAAAVGLLIAIGMSALASRQASDLEASSKEAAAERSRLDTVLRSMVDGVLAFDDGLRVLWLNPAALTLLDVPEGRQGQAFAELSASAELLELVTQGRKRSETRELLLGRTARRVLATAGPLRAAHGVLLVLRDVTEVRRLEQVRRDFVANVSHELRTPVSVIRANSETLLDGGIDDPQYARASLEAIQRASQRLSNLIADLLDLARIEGGVYELDNHALALTGVVGPVLGSVRELARSRAVTLVSEVPEGTVVRADDSALEQVLTNLVENAIKYTDHSGRVTVRARRDRGKVRIEVVDDGPGVPEAHRDRVFERFYRIDAGRSRELGGTGLGLSIVKHLVTAMGGEVGIDPVEPHGACFWVRLDAESRAGA
jgi:two-component system phosphate regulon sensor histidine kinase PhoR